MSLLPFFSTENATLAETGGLPPAGAGWIERPSERIAHAPEYLEWAVKRAGLRVARVRDCMVRRDGKAGEIHGKVFIAEHGSWNRRAASGYRVTTVAKQGGDYQPFLGSDGFLLCFF